MSAAGVHFISCLVASKGVDGYPMMINVMLLRIALTAPHCQAQKVDIIPNIPVDATFETDSGNRSFSGVIDYLLARVPDGASSGKLALYSLSNHLTSVLESSLSGLPNALDVLTGMPVTLTVIRADNRKMYLAIPQAALTVASYCNRQKSVHYFTID
jgi:hypothetical protein